MNWEVHADGKPRIYWNNGQVDWKAEDDLRTGQWEHFAFVRDAAKGLFSYYRNGQLHSTLTAPGTLEVSPAAFPFVGADHRGAAQTFKGQIDEVVIYNKVLTANEVFRIYSNAFDFPDFQFTTPQIISSFPPDDGVNVNINSTIEVVIDEANAQNDVVQDSVVLTVNGQPVDRTLSAENGLLTVAYLPTDGFTPGETYAVKIDYTDTGDIATTKEWSFSTAPAPSITEQPQGFTIVAGFSATLSVLVDSVPPTQYQWRFNGDPIPDGPNNPMLIFAAVELDDAGDYDVVITTPGGTVTSGTATLEVVASGVLSVAPAPDATFVLPATPIEVELVDADGVIPVDSMKLLLNGQEVAADIDSSQPGRHLVTYIPEPLEPSAVQTAEFRYMDPAINDVRVTEWSFTMAPYNLPPLDLTVDSVLYFSFDEETAFDGDDVLDQSPNANNGTLFVPEGGDRKVEGVKGGAIDFYPYSDAGEFDTSEFNRVETFAILAEVPNSFSAWVKIPADFSTARVGNILASCCDDPNAMNWEVHASGRPRIYWNVGNPDWTYNPHDLRTGEWEHIAFVRDASKSLFSYYRNGQLVATLTAQSEDVVPTLPSLVGADYRPPSRQVFKGAIDELVVFNKVLTANEVFQVFAAAKDFPAFEFPSPPIIAVTPVEDDFNVAAEVIVTDHLVPPASIEQEVLESVATRESRGRRLALGQRPRFRQSDVRVHRQSPIRISKRGGFYRRYLVSF